jgi:hypothetical protein
MKDVWRRKDRPPFKGEGGQGFSPSMTVANSQPQSQQQPANSEIISDGQRKRMYAIAKNANYTDEQFKQVILACGYSSSTDVLKKHYQAICESIEGTPIEQLPATIDYLAKWCKEN